jgi:hypothetical protein
VRLFWVDRAGGVSVLDAFYLAIGIVGLVAMWGVVVACGRA